jgi:type II secretory pathway predicted ATPase ExeA
MYEALFGMQGRPFDSGIMHDVDVFLGRQQDTAIGRFKVALASPDAIVTLSGPPGVGKTTLASAAVRATSTRLAVAWLNGMPTNGTELLELLLIELGMNAHRTTRIERLQMWRQYLGELNATDSRVFVIAERTEDLAPEVLRAIDSLTAADAAGCAGANVVLLGRPGLDQVLAAPELESLRQRIRLRQRLEPFSPTELTDYLRHRIERAGGDYAKIFAADAAAAVHRYSGGVARVANNLCETALGVAAADQRPQLTAALIAEVAVDMLGLVEANGAPSAPPAARPEAKTPDAKPAEPAASAPAPKPTPAASPAPAATPTIEPAAASAPPPATPAAAISAPPPAPTAVTPTAAPPPRVAAAVPPPVHASPAAPAPAVQTSTATPPKAAVVSAPASFAPPPPAPPTATFAPMPPPAITPPVPGPTVAVQPPRAPTPAPASKPAAAPPAMPTGTAPPAPAAMAAAAASPARAPSATVAPPHGSKPAAAVAAAEPAQAMLDDFEATETEFPQEDYEATATDLPDVASVDVPVLTDAVEAPFPTRTARAPAPMPAAPPTAAKAPPLIRATPRPAAPSATPAAATPNPAFARPAAAAPIARPPTPAAPPPSVAAKAATPPAPAPTPPAPAAALDEETDLARQTQTMRAISVAKSIDDISNSMAETLFGDADLDLLSAALASAGFDDPADATPEPPDEPADDESDDIMDLFNLGPDAPLELIDDSATPPSGHTRKTATRR